MMISKKKKILKRILTIIITFVMLSVVSFVATIAVYDSIFARYEGTEEFVPDALAQMVKTRERKEYYSGENKLCGYLYRSTIPDIQDGIVVMTPGINAGADDYLWQIQSFLEYGWSVFIFDATGSCESEGESAVGFPQILIDLENTLEYVEDNERFGYDELILFGHSRGGYAACCALEYDYDISAVISVSGVNSAMEAVIGSATKYVGLLAYGNYGNLWIYQTMKFGEALVGMSAEEEISEHEVPVLIVHGENDSEVPVDQFSIISYKDEIQSKQVEYAICSEPGQDGHTNLLYDSDGTANDKLMSQINDFLVRKIQ